MSRFRHGRLWIGLAPEYRPTAPTMLFAARYPGDDGDDGYLRYETLQRLTEGIVDCPDPNSQSIPRTPILRLAVNRAEAIHRSRIREERQASLCPEHLHNACRVARVIVGNHRLAELAQLDTRPFFPLKGAPNNVRRG